MKKIKRCVYYERTLDYLLDYLYFTRIGDVKASAMCSYGLIQSRLNWVTMGEL